MVQIYLDNESQELWDEIFGNGKKNASEWVQQRLREEKVDIKSIDNEILFIRDKLKEFEGRIEKLKIRRAEVRRTVIKNEEVKKKEEEKRMEMIQNEHIDRLRILEREMSSRFVISPDMATELAKELTDNPAREGFNNFMLGKGFKRR